MSIYISKEVYFYLHTNGCLIKKPGSITNFDPDYFDSPFVREVWKVDITNEESVTKFTTEATKAGVDDETIAAAIMEI